MAEETEKNERGEEDEKRREGRMAESEGEKKR